MMLDRVNAGVPLAGTSVTNHQPDVGISITDTITQKQHPKTGE